MAYTLLCVLTHSLYSSFPCSLPVTGSTHGVSCTTSRVTQNLILSCYLEFNDYNAALFNIRARSLNNLVYWVSQILGSVSIGLLLDQHQFRRRARAFASWSILLIFVFIVHTWAFFYQRYVLRPASRVPTNRSRKAPTHASPYHLTHLKWTFMTRVMQAVYFFTFFAGFSTRCGRPQYIG
jgi:hypothetical protein